MAMPIPVPAPRALTDSAPTSSSTASPATSVAATVPAARSRKAAVAWRIPTAWLRARIRARVLAAKVGAVCPSWPPAIPTSCVAGTVPVVPSAVDVWRTWTAPHCHPFSAGQRGASAECASQAPHRRNGQTAQLAWAGVSRFGTEQGNRAYRPRGARSETELHPPPFAARGAAPRVDPAGPHRR